MGIETGELTDGDLDERPNIVIESIGLDVVFDATALIPGASRRSGEHVCSGRHLTLR